jgi:predicted 3-demethylubiquinone-9 3-methyltransferase (glyoxalase superfamily)
MSKISPCLWFDRNAEEAARFYVSLLPDSHIDHVQKDVRDENEADASVLVVEFTLAGQEYVGLNGGSPMEYTHAVSFMVHCDDQAEVDRLWAALSEGGKPDQCGWIQDRYGVRWQITPKVMLQYLADPDREKARRAMQAMLTMGKLDIATIKAAYDGRS